MFASRSTESVVNTVPVRVKSISLLAKILTPKPKMQLDGPQSAYIKPRTRTREVRLNAIQIANERRLVKGLGYIRADATPYRSKAAKERGSTAPSAVEDDTVFQWPPVASGQATSSTPSSSIPSRSPGLYEVPRYPATYIPWPTSA